MLELPIERPLGGTEGSLYDEGFTLNRKILRPFCGFNLSVNKSVYNYHSISPDFAVDIVKASVFMQNFSRERYGYNFYFYTVQENKIQSQTASYLH